MKLRKYYPTIVLSDIHYLNSGDWVESMTALVENEQGEWNIVLYSREEYGIEDVVSSKMVYAEVI